MILIEYSGPEMLIKTELIGELLVSERGGDIEERTYTQDSGE